MHVVVSLLVSGQNMLLCLLLIGAEDVFKEIREVFMTRDVPVHYRELAEKAVQFAEDDGAFKEIAKMMCELQSRGRRATEERERCEAKMSDVMKNRSDVMDELIRSATVIHAKTISAETARDAAHEMLRKLGM